MASCQPARGSVAAILAVCTSLTSLTLPDPALAAGGWYFPPPGQTLAQQDQRSPSEVGLDAGVVSELNGRASRWALWRHGYLVHVEGDFNLNDEVKSLVKTWHALTVGAAIEQGRIPDLGQALSVWRPELTGNDALATWRHVMTQSSGFDYPGCGDTTDYLPGQMWTYSDLNIGHLNHALARVYGKVDYFDHYDDVLGQAYFDSIGMQGWTSQAREDHIRLYLDLEDMGRLGLLVLARGQWDGRTLVPRWFVEQLETKQTAGMLVNYQGCNDGIVSLDPAVFPEPPYGFLTWTNSAGDYHPGASTAWAFGAGDGGFYILWNYSLGFVYVGVDVDAGPTAYGIPHIIESHTTGPNPMLVMVVAAGTSPLPDQPNLAVPGPMPARDVVTLRFALPRAEPVKLAIYDATGRLVRVLARDVRDAGEHVSTWDGRDVAGEPAATGLYFVRLQAGNRVLTRRLMMVR